MNRYEQMPAREVDAALAQHCAAMAGGSMQEQPSSVQTFGEANLERRLGERIARQREAGSAALVQLQAARQMLLNQGKFQIPGSSERLPDPVKIQQCLLAAADVLWPAWHHGVGVVASIRHLASLLDIPLYYQSSMVLFLIDAPIAFCTRYVRPPATLPEVVFP